MSDPRLAEVALGGLTVNEILLDRSIRHSLYLDRIAEGYAQRSIRLIDLGVLATIRELLAKALPGIVGDGQLIGPIERQRLTELRATLREQASVLRQDLVGLWVPMFDELAIAEGLIAAKAIEEALPIARVVKAPRASDLSRITTQRPFEGQLLRGWASTVARDLVDRIDRRIRAEVMRGSSIPQITREIMGTTRGGRRVSGVFDGTRRDATSIVRTAAAHYSAHARELTYAANPDLVKGVKWVSTLDARTSQICIDLDSRVFKVGEGIRPPAHFACRSTTTPVLYSWKELGLPFNELPPGTRASMDGQVPDTITAREWLARQSPEVIRRSLGPTIAAEVLRTGKVPRLTDRTNRPLTVAQVLRREGVQG